jgi:hypothetical protein
MASAHTHAEVEAPPAGMLMDAVLHALGDGLTFETSPFTTETEITGPLAARLYISSTTADADLFLTLRMLDPDGVDVTFVSAMDPHGVPGVGWLRASHRKLDPERALPYRPFHAHDELQPLTPGEVVAEQRRSCRLLTDRATWSCRSSQTDESDTKAQARTRGVPGLSIAPIVLLARRPRNGARAMSWPIPTRSTSWRAVSTPASRPAAAAPRA